MDSEEALRVTRGLARAKGIRASGPRWASDWTVVGPDLDGDDLEIALIIEDGLLVVTVY